MDLNHLHLHVRDAGVASRFYVRWFDFQERVTHGDVLFLRNPDGFDLALAPDDSPPALPSWFHFGFRLPSAEAVRSLHVRMVASGVPARALHEEDGYVTFRCADPDGNGIEVYWE